MNHSERERLFLELLGANKSRIQRLCYGYLGSAGEVEDLFQEIMTNVWNSLPSFRGEAQARTWLYRIAMNTALVYRRKRKRGEELTDVVDERGGPHQDFEQQERLAALRTAIAALSDQDRLIVTLLLEGLSYREIADITGITVNYVGVKISRIKQALEETMTEVSHGAV
ncbi:MAG TPA: sigma-70 family RNA polymerase sigma factor [Bryobacteraceae bacterium]|nr:sigma-70 family RNA polymerase sigma factor [Bryobacteraceae bacterium]